MKPAPFAYHRPRSADEVDALLAELGSDAKILAGGQSLIPILNMRLSQPVALIDINRVEDLAHEPALVNGWVRTDALVRQSAAEHSSEVAERVPLLGAALEYVAHPAIRNRGTIAGSIAHSDPAAELPAVLAVLCGEVVARSTSGRHTISAADCFVGPLENDLKPTEWIEHVRFPARRAGEGFAFEEFARRSGDYGLCGVAATATRADGGFEVALSFMGMGDAPARLTLPTLDSDAIDGSDLEDALAGLVKAHLDPGEDIHATASYRAWLAVGLGLRAARRAATLAQAA
ncbi:MAG: FAD binding domain-containing protein [Actinomycetota bacterium]